MSKYSDQIEAASKEFTAAREAAAQARKDGTLTTFDECYERQTAEKYWRAIEGKSA